MNTPRVEPLDPAGLSERQRRPVQRFISAKGRLPNIFGVMLRNIELFEAWSGFGTYTLSGSRIDAQLREVLVLRTATNLRCEYEWHHHVRIALATGLGRDLIERLRARQPLDTPDQELMAECADQLTQDSMLGDAVWQRMTDRFGLEYTMDVVFTVGAYTALAMGLKSFGVQLEGRD